MPCLLILITGCASPGGNTFFGTVIGSVVGAGIGALAEAGPKGRTRSRNIFIGATIGALAGSTTGLLVERKNEKKALEPFEKPKDAHTDVTLVAPNEPGTPTLIPPLVDSYFVDDQIRGSIFIPGHMEYQIKEPARWTK